MDFSCRRASGRRGYIAEAVKKEKGENLLMPTIARFENVDIKMQKESGVQHKKPHIHAWFTIAGLR